MPKDLAVIIIHGMGSQVPEFANSMISEIQGRLADADVDPSRVAWQPIYWADILSGRQEEYLTGANKNNDLDFFSLRQFAITALSDAVAYQKVGDNAKAPYNLIHARIREKMSELYSQQLGGHTCPLVVMAHSLGGHIISSYIWDIQKNDATGLSEFEQFKTHAGFVTFGCNIPLFTFAYDKEEISPIRFPGELLSDSTREKSKWLNYYDKDDVLAYPLKPINDAYNAVVDKDIAINAGGVFANWNPMSHGAYWTDNNLTKPVAKYIEALLTNAVK